MTTPTFTLGIEEEYQTIDPVTCDLRSHIQMEIVEKFGKGGTGIAIHNGFLYLATTTSVERYKMAGGQLKPAATSEIIVSELPGSGAHADKGIAFDGRGSLYVNVGAPSNACQQPDRRAGVAGQDPCPLLERHGGIWKFDENKLGQKQPDDTGAGPHFSRTNRVPFPIWSG